MTRNAKIINLILVVVAAAAAVAVWQARQNHRNTVLTRTEKIGQDLITNTNSTHLDRIGWGLRVKLNEFLDADSKVTGIDLGDEPPPIGNDTAASRLFLMNGRGQCLGIRLQEDFEKFHVVGFWMVSEPRYRTNR